MATPAPTPKGSFGPPEKLPPRREFCSLLCMSRKASRGSPILKVWRIKAYAVANEHSEAAHEFLLARPDGILFGRAR